MLYKFTFLCLLQRKVTKEKAPCSWVPTLSGLPSWHDFSRRVNKLAALRHVDPLILLKSLHSATLQWEESNRYFATAKAVSTSSEYLYAVIVLAPLWVANATHFWLG